MRSFHQVLVLQALLLFVSSAHHINTHTDEHHEDIYDNYEFEELEKTKHFLSEDGITTIPSEETDPEYILMPDSNHNFSEDFMNCILVFIEPDYYQLLKNGSIYIDMYGKMYKPTEYYAVEDGVYVCAPDALPSTKDKSQIFGYVAFACHLLSAISLLSYLLTFCLVPAFRSLHGYSLASLSISLFMAISIFIAANIMKDKDNCNNVGICIYYFILASFFWMNVIAFDIWHSFRTILREVRVSDKKYIWGQFLLYSLYCWLSPAVLTALVKVADSTDFFAEDYKPSFDGLVCWFSQQKSLVAFFIVPIIIIMVLNTIFFIHIAFIISYATLKTSQSYKTMLKKRFFILVRLAIMIGLPWLLNLLALQAKIEFLSQISEALIDLQGFFIAIDFFCSSTNKEIIYGFCKSIRPKDDSVFTITSEISDTV